MEIKIEAGGLGLPQYEGKKSIGVYSLRGAKIAFKYGFDSVYLCSIDHSQMTEFFSLQEMKDYLTTIKLKEFKDHMEAIGNGIIRLFKDEVNKELAKCSGFSFERTQQEYNGKEE